MKIGLYLGFMVVSVLSCIVAKPTVATAVSIPIRGVVIDEKTGLPLPSVTVAVAHGGTAATTNVYGRFQLNLSDSMFIYREVHIYVATRWYTFGSVNVTTAMLDDIKQQTAKAKAMCIQSAQGSVQYTNLTSKQKQKKVSVRYRQCIRQQHTGVVIKVNATSNGGRELMYPKVHRTKTSRDITMSGRVVDQYGNGVPNIAVIYSHGGGRNTVSDANGYFSGTGNVGPQRLYLLSSRPSDGRSFPESGVDYQINLAAHRITHVQFVINLSTADEE